MKLEEVVSVDMINPKEPHRHDQCSDGDITAGGNAANHTGHDRKSHQPDKTKQNLITRLNRIEGQIRGIKGLIEKDTYCDDVITQISATQAALNSVAKILLEGHMRSCIVDRIQEGDHEVIDELLTTIQRLMKK